MSVVTIKSLPIGLDCLLTVTELHRKTARANHLAHTNSELASLLHSRHNPNDEDQKSKTSRKLARMAAVRQQGSNTDPAQQVADENKAVKSLMVSGLCCFIAAYQEVFNFCQFTRILFAKIWLCTKKLTAKY